MAASCPSVLAVNTAHVINNSAGGRKPSLTGIDKRPAVDPVRFARLGLVGDTICDTKHHGGVDQAVYAYASEDAQWWQDELGPLLHRELTPGSFGENLTLRGVDVTNSVIGERWQIGNVLLQVSTPRIPCSTFAAFWGVDKLIKRFTAAGRPGAYLRVLIEGDISAGDEIVVLERPSHGLTLAETFSALTGDRSLARKLLTAPELPDNDHRTAAKWLSAYSE